METWEPPTPARLAVFRALFATPDLWAVRHCVMYGDAALDAIRYRGGGIRPAVVGCPFPSDSPCTSYAAKRGALGLGVVGEVGSSAGLGLCGVGQGFASVRLPAFFPAGLYVVVKAA